jgi:hypothetical protein
VLDTCVFLVAKKEKKGRHMGNDRFFFNSRRSQSLGTIVYVTSTLYLLFERHQQIGYKFIRSENIINQFLWVAMMSIREILFYERRTLYLSISLFLSLWVLFPLSILYSLKYIYVWLLFGVWGIWLTGDTVVSPPSNGTSARHQLNGGSSNNSNSSSSSSNSSSSSFAAALRHLAKQAGGPTQSTIHSDPGDLALLPWMFFRTP